MSRCTQTPQSKSQPADSGGTEKGGHMSRYSQRTRWIAATIAAVATILIVRYVAALQSGVGHTVAIRTYLFWALVCAPVAHLTDIVIRSASQYRVVRLTVARVKNRR